MSALVPVSDSIWVVAAPFSFFGLHIGSRMTVIRLRDGSLALHSPVAVDTPLVADIDALGEVRHIICPNSFHHLFAADAVTIWPQATLYGPRALQRKRRDLTFQATLGEPLPAALASDFEAVSIAGSLLNETVLFHRDSGSLITADLIENFPSCDHAPTRWYLKINGALGQPTWPRAMRALYWRRDLARASIERILAWPVERVILAHGEIIEGNARDALRQGLAWLR